MKIMGIDPGLAIVGYSIIEKIKDEITLISSGSIQTDKSKSDAARLLEISNDTDKIIKIYKPDYAGIEKLFYYKNQKTIIPVAESRGVILAEMERNNIPFSEFTPIEVKQMITGYGRAKKEEVAQMVKLSVKSNKMPKLDDTLDAIAIALCCARTIGDINNAG